MGEKNGKENTQVKLSRTQQAIKILWDEGWTYEMIGEALGKSGQWIIEQKIIIDSLEED